MQSYLKHARVLQAHHPVLPWFVAIVVSGLPFMAPSGEAEPPSPGGTANDGSVAEDSNGPTLTLSYSREAFAKNPITSFMYFVPLISLTPVNRQTSANNSEEVVVVSYKRKVLATSFSVACDFEIQGEGFHKNSFDPTAMIASRTDRLTPNQVLTSVLDYIKFEGEGACRIEIEGTIDGSTETVTEVNLQFNARGDRSPVTIGTYDVKPKDGQYKYENRSNELVARVNTLAFRKGERPPTMGVTLASIAKPAAREGFFNCLFGKIATLFMAPPKIGELGNETMLSFGYAILRQDPEFTFPMAKNLAKDEIVPTPSPKQRGD